jgi:hypothetical protein
MIKAFMAAWCEKPSDAANALLTFQTLRIGFPTAAITVIDNATSIAEQVKACCRRNDCEYIRNDVPMLGE